MKKFMCDERLRCTRLAVGGDAAEENIGGAARKEGCTAGEEESWTAGAAEFEDVCGGCSIEEGRLGGCEKSRFNLF